MPRRGRPGARARDQRPGAAAEPGVRHGGHRDDATERAAVLGTGQTHHKAKRQDVSMAGLLREAIDRAMADAASTGAHRRRRGRQGAGLLRGRDDARAVPRRRARRRRQAAAAGAHRRLGRRLDRRRRGQPGAGRACTSGCSRWRGRSSPSRTRCGRCRSRSRSTCRSTPGAGGYFAPHVRSYIRRSGAPEHIGAIVAAKDRRNGAKNPYAHLRQADITSSRCRPRRCCGTRSATTRPARPPTARARWSSATRRRPQASDRPVAWIHATAMRSRADHRSPARTT